MKKELFISVGCFVGEKENKFKASDKNLPQNLFLH